MVSSDNLTRTCEQITENCTDCQLCVETCPFLQEIGASPIEIARRKPSVVEAYSCTLCGLCEAVCPASLSLKQMFWEGRKAAVHSGQIDIDAYRYMFPDRKYNVMSYYRLAAGIQYDHLNCNAESAHGFFPGCVMQTYSPELVNTIFRHLQDNWGDISLITDCCGLPLEQLGLEARAGNFTHRLVDKLTKLKIKNLFIACPNCYYLLKQKLSNSHIKLLTVYEGLESTKLPGSRDQIITVHDSCPDRHEGIFAAQARQALTLKGYTVKELPSCRETSICCGSGGQVTHFRPDLADQLVSLRWQELEQNPASIVAAYCLGCVLNLAKVPNSKKVQHVLNLLLDVEQDFTGVKAKAKEIFEGPQGEEAWNKIMAD